MNLVITDVQRFSIHDGPGIRTTVFFKGCSLCCPWCANPETISPNIEYYVKKNACKRNGAKCKYNPGCQVCSEEILTEIDYCNCNLNAIVRYGYEITEEDLLALIERDANYFKNNGGVTFSGGEPLLQLGHQINFMSTVHEKYHTAIETSLSTKKTKIENIDKYIDLYIIDLKTMIKSDYSQLLGGSLDIFLENIHTLQNLGRAKDTIFRIPFVKGITDKRENIDSINNLILSYCPKEIQVFLIHNLAKSKYQLLNKEMVNPDNSSKEDMIGFINKINHKNITPLHL